MPLHTWLVTGVPLWLVLLHMQLPAHEATPFDLEMITRMKQ